MVAGVDGEGRWGRGGRGGGCGGWLAGRLTGLKFAHAAHRLVSNSRLRVFYFLQFAADKPRVLYPSLCFTTCWRSLWAFRCGVVELWNVNAAGHARNAFGSRVRNTANTRHKCCCLKFVLSGPSIVQRWLRTCQCSPSYGVVGGLPFMAPL